jgi:acetoacetyl-CoA reductase
LAGCSPAALQHGIVRRTFTLIACASPGAHIFSKVQEETMTSRIALVTGGTGGIGSAICERLARNGLKVVTNYRDEGKARAWQERMKEKGFDMAIVPGDVGDPAAAAEMVATIQSQVGPVDVLVNNAGITRDTTFHRMTPEQWHEVINTNLNSCFNVTRPVIEGMRERKWGRVIQISSINGLKGQYGQANYAAAKAGMHGFTISLARENAKLGITVNTVSPGYVATDMVMAVPEEVRAKIVADIPTGRLGKPEEIAYAVAFLVSDEAAWITGSNLDINGGHHMGW